MNEGETAAIFDQVTPLMHTGGHIMESRAEIRNWVEAPLVTTVEILYDKNIPTTDTSASVRDPNTFLSINYDGLSAENMKIANELVALSMERENDRPERATIDPPTMIVPIRRLNVSKPQTGTTPEETTNFFESFAQTFVQQGLEWAAVDPSTIDGDPNELGYTQAIDGLWYPSAELAQKQNQCLNQIQEV